MAFYDLALDILQTYQPEREEPLDFDDFWQTTLAETQQYPLSERFIHMDFGLRTLETFDVYF